MINTLHLEGFKSLLFEEIELGQLTLLTGINSSGKSSVIQAIRLLELVHRKKPPMLPGHGTLEDLKNPYSDELKLKASLGDGQVTSFSFAHGPINGVCFGKFPNLLYIAADRYGPESYVEIYPGHNYQIGSRGENVFKCIEWYDLNATNLPQEVWHSNAQGSTFMFNLEAWLGVISPNHGFKAQVQELSDTSFGTFNNRRAKNVGFGLSYVLPVIVALFQATLEPDTVLLLENPEAHLHPRGQTEMANLIAKCVEAGAQVIVETHSDHVFDGIRVFAKQSQTDFHKKVKAFWFELDDNLNSVVEEIEIDENGRISNSPAGLFDQFEINGSKLL